jgi:ArsR family transcriptional regulator
MHTLAQLFKALSDASRLRILNLLFHSGELCVCDIESVMGFTQTKVSRHLSYLKRAGLVADRRQGLWMLYSIPRPESEDQRRVINCLGVLLKANTVAQRDAERLASNISAGCCATFERVHPAVKSTIKVIRLKSAQKKEHIR